jgi:DeoR/GlpR family transcriptional regulator of sugar metabolism
MLHSERIENIRSIIKEKGTVTCKDLCSYYNVSDVTIRKDLALLEKDQFIERIHGGAVLKKQHTKNAEKQNPLSNIDKLNVSNYEVKFEIAKIALDQINDGDIIFLGSGVTCCILAELLKQKNDLIVVTNNLSAVSILIHNVKKVLLIGGEVSTVDGMTYFSSIRNPSHQLESVFVNKAFTSCSGIDLKAGVTVNSVISTYIYKAIPDIKRQWYMMIDDEKYDKIGMYQVCSIESLDYIISNKIPNDYLNYFKSNKIQAIVSKKTKS